MTEALPPAPDISEMVAVHQVLRSSLDAAPALVASTRNDPDRRALVSDYYANVLAFLEVHHEGEELLVFPRLAERAPSSVSLIERMTDQHHDIVGRLEASKTAVTVWSESGDVAAATAAETLVDLGRTLSVHLDQEEAEVLPLAGQYLSVEEWGELPGHAMANFSGDKVWLILGLIRENFTQPQRDTMLAHMPPPARTMWETMGEGAFAATMAEVRRTP